MVDEGGRQRENKVKIALGHVLTKCLSLGKRQVEHYKKAVSHYKKEISSMNKTMGTSFIS